MEGKTGVSRIVFDFMISICEEPFVKYQVFLFESSPPPSRVRVPPPPPPGFGDEEYYRLYGRPEEYHRYRERLEREGRDNRNYKQSDRPLPPGPPSYIHEGPPGRPPRRAPPPPGHDHEEYYYYRSYRRR